MTPLTGSDALNHHFTAQLLILESGFHPNFFLSHSFFCGHGKGLAHFDSWAIVQWLPEFVCSSCIFFGSGRLLNWRARTDFEGLYGWLGETGYRVIASEPYDRSAGRGSGRSEPFEV
jgi:hypothetical protein